MSGSAVSADVSSMPQRETSSRLRIIVLGYIVRGPVGGLAWHHLQYVMGLAHCGHDVYFAEDSGDNQQPKSCAQRTLLLEARQPCGEQPQALDRIGALQQLLALGHGQG